MQMTLRWFGPGHDSVTLEQIRQIPGVHGVVTSLMDKLPGEVWTREEIVERKALVESSGLTIAAVESVNISDDIKTGKGSRDQHIDNYITTLENLAAQGIKLIAYNFMPVFDWTRTDLYRVREDKGLVLAYEQEIVDKLDPQHLKESISSMTGGKIMPGWEPERIARLEELFHMYEGVTEDMLFNNLVYFLKAIGPVCRKYDIRMAIHPDDPAWPIFGLPRIIRSRETIRKLLKAVDEPYNGLTFCTGSLGSNPDNDLIGIIEDAKGRIPFAHIRNLRHNREGDFEESAHLSSDGSFDMYVIMKTLHDTGFDGVIRPDHGRQIWGEKGCVPGYGLYDRALGASYLQGIWEAICKESEQKDIQKAIDKEYKLW